MMVITRLYPENASVNLWDAVISSLKNCDVNGITPLYVSQRDDRGFTSIVSEAQSPDTVMELLNCEELKLRAVRRSTTITLAKPLFFPTASPGGKMRRYHFSIRVRPSEVRSVHHSLRKSKPTPKAELAYLACSFGDEDIVGSMVAVDYDTAKEFLMNNIGNLSHIVGFNIARVAYSKRLVDDKTWNSITTKYSQVYADEVTPGPSNLDWTFVDQALITCAFNHELEQ